MNTTLHPLLNARGVLNGITESRVDGVWHSGLPVVLRDVDPQERVPAGVCGMKRNQRAAYCARLHTITRVCTPEPLADSQTLLHSPFIFLSHRFRWLCYWHSRRGREREGSPATRWRPGFR